MSYRILRRLSVLPLSTVLLAVGCAPPPVDREAELAALRQAATAYHEAATAKDAARVVALYDEGAVMVPPNADMVEGPQEVRGYRFGFITTPGVELRFEIVHAEVSASGDMGWTLAIVEITIHRPDGPPGSDRVRDFHVWKKQADGSWKVAVDIWSSGLPVGG